MDALGRLVSATVGGVTRTYACDPLDRLVPVSQGGNAILRFRYVGKTASVAQLLDGAWAVTQNIGTDWSGTSEHAALDQILSRRLAVGVRAASGPRRCG